MRKTRRKQKTLRRKTGRKTKSEKKRLTRRHKHRKQKLQKTRRGGGGGPNEEAAPASVGRWWVLDDAEASDVRRGEIERRDAASPAAAAFDDKLKLALERAETAERELRACFKSLAAAQLALANPAEQAERVAEGKKQHNAEQAEQAAAGELAMMTASLSEAVNENGSGEWDWESWRDSYKAEEALRAAEAERVAEGKKQHNAEQVEQVERAAAMRPPSMASRLLPGMVRGPLRLLGDKLRGAGRSNQSKKD